VEQAIFVTKVKDLKYVDSRYSRLYFGNEFCPRLTASLEDFKVVKDFISKRNMEFTFVTPYVTNKEIDELTPILEFVIKDFLGAEIVVNDWGFLRLIRREFNCSNLALGRLLTKQKRGPRILNLKNKVPDNMFQHFRESNVDLPLLSDFLVNNGIKRVELDNLLQGVSRANSSLKASLYFPFAYVTTTRFCIISSSEKRRKFLRSIQPCNKECQKYTFRLKHKNMPVDFFLKGNTQFFRNDKLTDNLAELRIDRIVYEPEIPL
jgi:hypothetical protein